MPSSHSALCTALTTSVAVCHGVADSRFPVCLGFSLIVMYDAIGVRRHAGMQAEDHCLLLKYINHEAKACVWEIGSYLGNEQIWQIITASDLAPLVRCSYKTTNKLLIAPFVVQRHLETNIFHLSFGEMSITLDDVSVLLGVHVTGKTVTTNMLSNEDAISLIAEGLGMRRANAYVKIHGSNGQFLCSWLRRKFGNFKG